MSYGSRSTNRKRVAEIKANDERRQEVHENEQLEAVKSELDKKMNKISSDVAAVKNSIASPSAPVAPFFAYGIPSSQRANVPAAGAPADVEENIGGSRFYMLTEIDKEYANTSAPITTIK